MAVNEKSGIVFALLILGCLALPKPEQSTISTFDFYPAPTTKTHQHSVEGGSIALLRDHPHMAALTNGKNVRTFFCGGSIITQRTVLTAAHCIAAVFRDGSLSSSLLITVGTDRWNRGGSSYSVSSNATHKHYVASTLKNDLGVLYTANNITFTHLMKPVSLGFEIVDAEVEAKAAGWGRTSKEGPVSVVLMELMLSTITGQKCAAAIADAAANDDNFNMAVEPPLELCAIHKLGPGHGMCFRDSGSALVRTDNRTQIGIVSWGVPCAVGAPEVFVRVSAYEAWFREHIRN